MVSVGREKLLPRFHLAQLERYSYSGHVGNAVALSKRCPSTNVLKRRFMQTRERLKAERLAREAAAIDAAQ